MKKTQLKELFNNIKRTKVSFISITLFVALGVSMFLGMTWTGETVKDTTNREMDDGKLYDLKIDYPYGFSRLGINKIAELDGVDEIEPYRCSYGFYENNFEKYQIKVCQLNSNINLPLQIKGKLPKKIGEIAVEGRFAKEHHIHIGDIITLKNDNNSQSRQLNKIMSIDTENFSFNKLEEINKNENKSALLKKRFKVTALIENSDNIYKVYGFAPNSNTIDGLMYCSKNTFDRKAYMGHTELLLRNDKLRNLNTFSDEYVKKSNAFKTSISQDVDAIADRRYNRINKQINDVKNALDNSLKSARAEIKKGKIAIVEGEREINNAKDRLNSEKIKFNKYKKQYTDEKNKKSKILASFKSNVKTFSNIMSEAVSYQKNGDILGLQEFFSNNTSRIYGLVKSFKSTANQLCRDSQIAKDLVKSCNNVLVLLSGENLNIDKLMQSMKTLSGNLQNMVSYVAQQDEKNETEISKMQQEIAINEAKIKNAVNKLNISKQRLKESKIEYRQGRKEVKKFKKSLLNLVKYSCKIGTRESDVSLVPLKSTIEAIMKMRYTLGLLFLIVGLLVCYSAAYRLVYEQTKKIGTKKALGFFNREVTISYLLYSSLATLLGIVVGIILSRFAFAPIMLKSYSAHYIFYSHKIRISFSLCLIIALLELVSILACSWLSCGMLFKKNVIELLSGNKELRRANKKYFFEKWGIWKSMSLFFKTIVRNCISDKRRVIATIIGVMGCTALMSCAMMGNENMGGSFDKQYEDIFLFDKTVQFQEKNIEEKNTEGELKNILKKHGYESASLAACGLLTEFPDGSQWPAKVFINKNDNFNNFIKINPIKRKSVDTDEGVWVNVAYFNEYGESVGDNIKIFDNEGQEHDLKIAGFFEYYLCDELLIISEDFYEKEIGDCPANNTIIFNSHRKNNHKLEKDLSDIKGFVSLKNYYEETKSISDSMTTVARCIVVLNFSMAVVLGFLVLLNLYAMFINERKKELITLLINGFDTIQAKKYIYMDAILLTVIGIIAGLFLGYAMGIVTLKSLETNALYVIKDISWKANIIAVICSAGLSISMAFLALRRVDKFKMSDINK